MNHYQDSFDISADTATVYAALTTVKGLRGWWTQDCTGETAVGDTLHFRFGRTSKGMRIERLEPGREVHWLCTHAHIAADRLARRDEWVGTRIIFRLTSTGDGRTRLDFEHIGLVPEMECYDLCSGGWDYYLPSLRQFAETGRGRPHEVAASAAA